MILSRLKHETKQYHDALENALLLGERVFSLAEYQAMLGRFWGLYRPIEAHLATFAQWSSYDFDLNQRMKTGLIERDLQAFGWTAPAITALPVCPFPPSLPDFHHAVGCLYVLEGATLGGQLIARQLHATLDLTSHHGAAFFTSYGAAVGPMWLGFRALVGAVAQSTAAEDAIVAGAIATFVAFEHWLGVVQ